jgi:hypothetical protein
MHSFHLVICANQSATEHAICANQYATEHAICAHHNATGHTIGVIAIYENAIEATKDTMSMTEHVTEHVIESVIVIHEDVIEATTDTMTVIEYAMIKDVKAAEDAVHVNTNPMN